MRVLVIEDEEGFRSVLALALRRRGCDVLMAASTRDALKLAGAGGIDGVVLDMRLGAEDGMALIPNLRRVLPEVRLVVLTGFGSIPSALQAIRLGADDYLLKSASADQIFATLRGRTSTVMCAPETVVPSLARLEWEHIQRVLKECGGNVSQTAAALGIDRRTLQRKLAKMPPQR